MRSDLLEQRKELMQAWADYVMPDGVSEDGAETFGAGG